jgi:hypothetical protein
MTAYDIDLVSRLREAVKEHLCSAFRADFTGPYEEVQPYGDDGSATAFLELKIGRRLVWVTISTQSLDTPDEVLLEDGTVVPLSEIIKQQRQAFIDEFGCVPPAWWIVELMQEAGFSPEKIEGYTAWAELIAPAAPKKERRPRRRRQARRKH